MITNLQEKIINDYFKRWYNIPAFILYIDIEFKNPRDTISIIKQLEDRIPSDYYSRVKIFKEGRDDDVKEEYETDYIA